jgi:LmbE family N-acetylglucosaminyl deacetylase
VKSVLVIAPHCDDETLGCGGTLIRHTSSGDDVHWAIVTSASTDFGHSPDRVRRETEQIQRVARSYGLASTRCLQFKPAFLDGVPISDIVAALKHVVDDVKPDTIYLPHSGDVHSDHGIVAHAAVSCAKWFRASSVQRILAYETLSETECGLLGDRGFRPNVFVDVTPFLSKKIEIMTHYESEMGEFPFPRSAEALRALAAFRGATAGFPAAEAFMLLTERY